MLKLSMKSYGKHQGFLTNLEEVIGVTWTCLLWEIQAELCYIKWILQSLEEIEVS